MQNKSRKMQEKNFGYMFDNKGIGKPMCIRRSRDMIQHGTYFTRSCDIIQDQKWNKTIATRDRKTRIKHQNKKPHNKVIGNTDPEQK